MHSGTLGNEGKHRTAAFNCGLSALVLFFFLLVSHFHGFFSVPSLGDACPVTVLPSAPWGKVGVSLGVESQDF